LRSKEIIELNSFAPGDLDEKMGINEDLDSDFVGAIKVKPVSKQVDITTGSSTSEVSSNSRSRNFYQFNVKDRKLNVYCKPGNSLAKLLKMGKKVDFRDEKFKLDLQKGRVELIVHPGKNHKDFMDFPHYRSNLVRGVMTKILASNPEYSSGFELCADPTKHGTKFQRTICDQGQVPSLTDRDMSRFELLKGKPLPQGFCTCTHWAQCTHMPEEFKNELVVLKDAGYYGVREIKRLLMLGYRVLVVGWHYKDATEAYNEVNLSPTDTDGLYRHCWEDGENGESVYIHEMPSEIDWPEGGRVVEGFGSYKAILYSPEPNCLPKVEGGPTEPQNDSDEEKFLGPNLDAQQLLEHKYQGDFIKDIYSVAARQDATSANNYLISEIVKVTQNRYALDWPQVYSLMLINAMTRVNTDLCRKTTSSQREDMRNSNLRKKDILHEYDGYGCISRALRDSVCSLPVMPRNWNISRQPLMLPPMSGPPAVQTMNTATVTEGIVSTIVAVPASVMETINS